MYADQPRTTEEIEKHLPVCKSAVNSRESSHEKWRVMLDAVEELLEIRRAEAIGPRLADESDVGRALATGQVMAILMTGAEELRKKHRDQPYECEFEVVEGRVRIVLTGGAINGKAVITVDKMIEPDIPPEDE